jgi:hypothetical protein
MHFQVPTVAEDCHDESSKMRRARWASLFFIEDHVVLTKLFTPKRPA